MVSQFNDLVQAQIYAYIRVDRPNRMNFDLRFSYSMVMEFINDSSKNWRKMSKVEMCFIKLKVNLRSFYNPDIAFYKVVDIRNKN